MALLFALLAWAADASAGVEFTAGVGDASALVQRSLKANQHLWDEADVSADELKGNDQGRWINSTSDYLVGEAVQQHTLGPMAYTKLGPVLGKQKDNYISFLGIPYTEKPERFEVAQPKKPWAPKIYDATEFRPFCIGSDVAGHKESEDCLTLDMWVPKGGFKDMPVIVYFHGGINQHGSNIEFGDGIANSSTYRTIFVSLHWRLGILGWISLPGSNITENLGLHDQQAALRWLRENVAAFGGDPSQVTLQGFSEGCGSVVVHMAAPGSSGLFRRAVLHSAVADFWSRDTSLDKTGWTVRKVGCERKRVWSTVRCLRRKSALKLSRADFIAEELSHDFMSPAFVSNLGKMLWYAFWYNRAERYEFLREFGWHPVVDNVTLFGEPRDLIRRGHFHSNLSVLLTVTLNETLGLIPEGVWWTNIVATSVLTGFPGAKLFKLYDRTLQAQGIKHTSIHDLSHQMTTDKVFLCDARSFASDIVRGGGRAHVSIFAHAPKYAPKGCRTSRACRQGASCHADDLLYVLEGAEAIRGEGMEKERDFSRRYHDSFLAFVHGNDTGHPWVPYDTETMPITFYRASGATVVPKYREEQCGVLDQFMSPALPIHMRSQVSHW